MKKNIILLLCASLLVGCGETKVSSEEESTIEKKYQIDDDGEVIIDGIAPVKTEDNYRVFYEIFTGSFSDSNGDGYGDIQGIINRLDYLNDGDETSGKSLGVEGIWLTPIFQSPTYHKYDVKDYYKIDPLFGTTENLVELVEKCHERNIKVILDMVINHTSIKNAWFEAFASAHRNDNPEDPYYDFYSYYDSSTSGSPSGRTFNQLSGTTIQYECNFDGNMPELNFDNEAVREEILNVAKYYLDLGVDGFRFDAAKYIYFGDNVKSAQFWDWYIGELKKYKNDIYTVAEVWDGDAITNIYYPYIDCFDFTMSQSEGKIADTAKQGNVYNYTSYVQNYLNKIHELNEDSMMMPFVTNHDMDRAAGFLTPASGNMQMAANLYILSSGSPFIYYGEEIGMKGSRSGAPTDADRRLAMLWGDSDTVRNPTGATYPKSSQKNGTVASQIGDENSLLNYYKKLIMIRKANPEIARGEYKALRIAGNIGGFIATYDGKSVMVIHNTQNEEVSFDISLLSSGEFTKLNASIGLNDATLDGSILTLGAKTSVVLR